MKNPRSLERRLFFTIFFVAAISILLGLVIESAVTTQSNDYWPTTILQETFKENGILLSAIMSLLLITAWITSQFMAKKLLHPVTKIKTHLESLERTEPKQWTTIPPEIHGPLLGTLAEVTNHLIMRVQSSYAGNQALARSIAHELRTPLTMMLGELETLPSNASPDEYRSLVERFSGDILQMERIVSSILEVVHRGRKLSNSVPRPISLIEQLESLKMQFLRATHVNIHINQLDPLTPPLLVDPDLFRILLDNLFRNAIRHGGPTAQIQFHTTRFDADHLTLTIEDDGPGIPPSIINALEKGTFTTGMGIGLNLCREICNLTGWEMKVKCKPEGGTLVHITVPTSRLSNSESWLKLPNDDNSVMKSSSLRHS